MAIIIYPTHTLERSASILSILLAATFLKPSNLRLSILLALPSLPPHAMANKIPSIAGMYDAYIGGNVYNTADYQAAQQFATAFPDVFNMAAENRDFLARVVQYMVGQGIHQFIDIGCGYPAVGTMNTHEIALAANPLAKIVYVDTDPAVCRS